MRNQPVKKNKTLIVGIDKIGRFGIMAKLY
jgi:hypothetical protein